MPSVITTTAPAHIQNLGSEEAIADAKAEIFEGLPPGGTAVIAADGPHFARLRRAALKRKAKVLSFGRAEHADVRLLDGLGCTLGQGFWYGRPLPGAEVEQLLRRAALGELGS